MAIEDELKSHEENGTWEWSTLPAGRKAVGSKRVFKIKRGTCGQVIRYKARLVAKGFSQVEGLDYTDTFAPVASIGSIRTLFAYVSAQGWMVHQMDVKTAFLHGEIEEEIYMQPPPGTKGEEGQVCRLRKAIYGLKQASRSWYLRLHQILRDEGFRRNEVDASVYIHGHHGVILAVYVDDIIVISPTEKRMKEIKGVLTTHFSMTDGGNINYCLGLEIRYNPKGNELTITQGHYVDHMISKFRMKDAATVATPMELGDDSGPHDDLASNVPYRSLIGSLMYVGICTRPDICTAIGRLSRYLEKPSVAHWSAAKRVLRYLKGTRDVGLKYAGNNTTVQCYVDADWAGDVATRKLTTGMVIKMGEAAILWNRMRQSCVALSTAEAEYMALAHGVRECLWLSSFMKEAGLKEEMRPIQVWSDNQSAIAMAKQSGTSKRVKHVDIKFHFIKDQVENGAIRLEYCPTEKMVADALTKPLAKERVIKLRGLLGLKELKMQKGDAENRREEEQLCARPRGRLLEIEVANHTTCQLDGHLKSATEQ